jgi:hypothetical protein
VATRLVADSLSNTHTYDYKANGCVAKLTLGYSQKDKDKGLGTMRFRCFVVVCYGLLALQ